MTRASSDKGKAESSKLIAVGLSDKTKRAIAMSISTRATATRCRVDLTEAGGCAVLDVPLGTRSGASLFVGAGGFTKERTVPRFSSRPSLLANTINIVSSDGGSLVPTGVCTPKHQWQVQKSDFSPKCVLHVSGSLLWRALPALVDPE